MAEHFGVMLGFAAAGFSLVSFTMKRMLPLRALAMVSNVFFLAYGYVEWQLPPLVLHTILLPLNAWRIWEIRKLSAEIAKARGDSPVSLWLLPHMTRQTFRAGEVLFRKGDIADRLIYVAKGALRLAEIGQAMGEGELLGEVGLFSPDKTRTYSVTCESDGELYWMTEEMIFKLCYQNPGIGFYLMKLVTARLLLDVRRQEGISPMAA